MHVYTPRPPSETLPAAVSHSAGAMYSSPSTHTTAPTQHQPTTAVSSVLSPDQAAGQISSTGPLMTTTPDLQQGACLACLTFILVQFIGQYCLRFIVYFCLIWLLIYGEIVVSFAKTCLLMC